MRVQLTMTEYNADWALTARNLTPRSLPGFLTLEQVIAFYGTLGIDGLELFHPYWEADSPDYLRQIAADAGLPIVSYIFFVDLALPPAARPAAIDEAYALLDRTAKMGATLAMIVPAKVKDDVPLTQQRAWVVEGLRECAARALSLGVTLVSENIDDPPTRPLMGRGSDCRDMCAAVDSPGFRLIYDAGAPLFVDEDPLETLHAMAPFIAHVHVKNSRPLSVGEHKERYLDSESGQRYISTQLDEGVVALAPILAELNRLGYDGTMMIEYQGEDDPRIALQNNLTYLRAQLAHVQS